MAEETDNTIPIYFLFFASLLAIVLFLSKWLHNRPKLNAILSEPAMVLLVGIFCSFFVSVFLLLQAKFFNHQQEQDYDDYIENAEEELTQLILSFFSNIFFMALLPPILFNSGYQLQRELFYRHIKPITMFATLGTTLSAFATGFALYGVKLLGWMGDFDPTLLELLTFGALIAATDSVSVLGVLQAKRVDPHLFSLVFGESALNDAVAIVLFRTLSNMLRGGVDNTESILHAMGVFAFDLIFEGVGSPVLGIFFASLTALIFKHVELRDQKIVELSLYILLIYTPFVLAEVCHLSGIVAIFFTGMSARRYIEPNVSEQTKLVSEVIFKLTAYLAETCIFLELGLSVFGLSGSFKWRFIGCAFCAALFGRAASIYPLSVLFNLSLKEVVVQDPPTELSVEDDGTLSVVSASSQNQNQLYLDMDVDELSVGSESSGSTVSSFSLGKNRKSKSKKHSRKRKTPAKRKDKQIPVKFMHIMWFAGLRGAVAYACAREFPDLYGHNDEFIAATMCIVLVTIIFMGGGTEPLLDRLQIRTNVDEEEYMKEWRKCRRLKGWFHDLEYKYLYTRVVRDVSADQEADHGSFELMDGTGTSSITGTK